MTDLKVDNHSIQLDVLKRGTVEEGEVKETEKASKEGIIGEAKAAGTHIVNAGASAANIAGGGLQVLGGILGALKDLTDAGWHGLKAADFGKKLDKEVADLEAKGELAAHEQQRLEHLKIAQANMGALKDKDWKKVKEGLKRMATGLAYTINDVASVGVHAAKVLLSIGAAVGFAIGKAVAAVGACIGRGLKAAVIKIKEALLALGKAIGHVAESAGKAVGHAARKVGHAVREGYEDVMTWIAKGAAAAANKAANNAPRLELKELQDNPTVAK